MLAWRVDASWILRRRVISGSALAEYRDALAEHVGDVAARLTMLVRAFPAVARLLRDETDSA